MRQNIFLTLLLMLILSSCKSSKPTNYSTTDRIIPIYDIGKDKINSFHFSKTNSFSVFNNGIINRRYKTANEVIDDHGRSPSVFLSEFLSVNNEDWYKKMFYKEHVFKPIPIEVFASRNMSREESYEILKAFQITYDSRWYNVIKTRHTNYKGETSIEQMILTLEGDRLYLIEKVDNLYLKDVIDTFYLLKQEIGVGLTNYLNRRDFPPTSGNQNFDKIIYNEVYYNFNVHDDFNISRFMDTVEQWKKERKTGLLNYFFE